MKRKSISKKLRFEVFKRDSFACQYCNSKPPKVALEIDHINPVSKGGDNNIDNLITACFECNRGKSNIQLDSIPNTLLVKTENKRIAVEQYKEYQKLLKKEKVLIEKQINSIEDVYKSFYSNYYFSDNFRITVKKFIQSLSFEEAEDSIERACFKINNNSESALKYFCGICWNKIRENE